MTTSPRRPRIALVNVFFPPQAIGGATRVLADNVDVLRQEYADRFDTVVFTTDAEHDPVQDEFAAELPERRIDAYPWQGLRVYRAAAWWRPNMDWQPRDAAMGAAFARFLDFEQPDLVHFHCIQRITGSAVEAVRERGIPYLVTLHDAWWISDHQFLVDAQGTVYPDAHADIAAPVALPDGVDIAASFERRGYLKSLLQGAAAVLTVSRSFAGIHARNGVPDVIVNPNGLSPGCDWRPKQTAYTPRVVCALVGGLADHKGYALFRTAVQQVQPRHIEVLLVDHARDEHHDARSAWGAVPVRTVGRQPQQRVAALYSQLDVLFAPSIWPESYGLVTREAAACGCWIVASSRGGIGEDVTPGNGFVIEPTVEALAAVVRRIDADVQRYKGLSAVPPMRTAADQVAELVTVYARSLRGGS